MSVLIGSQNIHMISIHNFIGKIGQLKGFQYQLILVLKFGPMKRSPKNKLFHLFFTESDDGFVNCVQFGWPGTLVLHINRHHLSFNLHLSCQSLSCENNNVLFRCPINSLSDTW